MLIGNLFHLALAGGHAGRARLSRWRWKAGSIIRRSLRLTNLTDAQLERSARELRWRCMSGEPLPRLMPVAYALVREATRRATGLTHYPVQVMGGIALFEGGIAEMQTGEGKTLTALFPTFLHALAGQGCHVITANEYLAERDAELGESIFGRLGMTVGCIRHDISPDERGPEYAADVTYGTAKEMGFDFLRDRLKKYGQTGHERTRQFTGIESSQSDRIVQRGLYFALIDEADSILIDEAKTPLLIALGEDNDAESVGLFRWCARAVDQLHAGVDYHYDPRRRSVCLSEAGCRRILALPKPASIARADSERVYRQLERALTAEFAFQRDRDYVVDEENKLAIVDESTGRLMDGRKWQDGLHQAIEAKERVPITQATRQAARMTVQTFFNQYIHLAGLTGTATPAAREFKRTYRLRVTTIPTHRPRRRRSLPPRVFATRSAKLQAVATEILRLLESGRAVLVGTPSVEASEALGQVLVSHDIPHQILNCRFHKEEAEIIRRAGEPGKVTVATNMAGRGTDIKLERTVVETGGLHVIATEMHSSARIDRQLIGRTARQGEPGSYQFFLSLEDELLRCLSPQKLPAVKSKARPNSRGELSKGWVRFFQRTQSRLERMHKKARKQLLKQEDERRRHFQKMGLDPYLEMTD
jgi:preprotein translocase subunit SecA